MAKRGHVLRRLHQRVDHFLAVARLPPAVEARPAEAVERAPQLRLEDDRAADEDRGERVVDEEVHHGEVEHPPQDDRRQEECDRPAQLRHRAGAAQQP
jgi:hypothetical protein